MKGFGELDVSFDEISGRLCPDASEIFALPAYAEVARNLVSMANYLPLLEPLLDQISPHRMCEIGAYRGISTRALADISFRYGGELLVVEPAFEPHEAPVQKEGVQYFKMLSEEFLAQPREVDVFFIDGDHNYEVVTTELRLIIKNQCKDRVPVLLMHDTGWPCAYRDMYYDVARIKNKHPTLIRRDVPLTDPDLSEVDISLPQDIHFAEYAGGPQNGVRTAIADFLASNSAWRCIHLPSLYGLGVLWNTTGISEPVAKRLAELEALFERMSAFLSILELNRVLLLSEISRQGEEWKENQAFIKENQAQLAWANQRIARLETAKGALHQFLKRIFRRE